MNKEQATELSSFIPENSLGSNLKIYDDIQGWDIDNENSDCDFWIGIINYIDGSVELAVNMKHLYNKAKDCPIIVKFPESKEGWERLKNAMNQLRSDCIPKYMFEKMILEDRLDIVEEM
jgi:hypothetical protein